MALGSILTVIALSTGYYFAYKKPIYALGVIIVALPTFLMRWHIGPIGFNTLDVLIVGSFVVWFIRHRKEGINFAKNNTWVLHILATVTLVALAALVVSPEKVAAAGILKSYFIAPLLFLFMAVAVIKDGKDLRKILFAFSILTLMVGTAAILQIWFPETIPNPNWRGPENFRATSFLVYPNAIGLLLAPVIPLLIYLHTTLKHRWLIILNAVSIAMGLWAIWLAKSKGAIIGLTLTAIIVGVYLIRKKLKYVLLALLFLIIIVPPSIDTLVTKIGPGSYSAQLRFIQWQETIELLKDRPFTGAGLAGFQTAIEKYHTVDFIEIFLYPHNIILNFWVELGLMGMLVFMTLLLYSLIKNVTLLKTNTPFALAGAGAILIILIHGIVDVPYFKNDLAVVFWFLWSWPMFTAKIKHQN